MKRYLKGCSPLSLILAFTFSICFVDAAFSQEGKLPRLLDLGSKKCIPCKKMAPILEGLKKEYARHFKTEFIDVWLAENKSAAVKHKIELIPTQIFFDGAGKELWRHEGFLSKEAILAKWKELGFDFSKAQAGFARMEPAKADPRSKNRICYMCDGSIDSKTAVVVKTDTGDVRLCSPHCYFIMYSCLNQDKEGAERSCYVTDWATGKLVRAKTANYVRGIDAVGRPMVKAFASPEGAREARGNLMSWELLKAKELSHRCGFCDRSVYPEDSAVVRVAGVYTWGCCPHCALGVAARTGKDVEVRQRDGLTGEMVVVRTLDGTVASLEPKTAVAWFGMKKKPDGAYGSAGCFHQAFFVNEANLRRWVEKHPHETGKMISIGQALASKMKLTPQQITKACKIGECVPK